MTREEAKKILGENATDEQITNLLNAYHTEVNAKNDTINDLTNKLNNSQKKIETLTNIEKEFNDLKKSQMSEQELIEQQKKELAEQISSNKKFGNSIKAKSILVGAGISSERADELVGKFVKEDEQATVDLANDFVQEINSIKELTAKQVKDNLANNDLRPNPSNIQPNDDKKMTWDKFQKLSLTEQDKFQKEHPEEFNAL